MLDLEKLEPVLRLASLNWKLYPASRHDWTGKDPGKSPWCEHGFLDATSDVGQIFAWASEKHGCNWAIRPCEGMVTLDADAKHGGLERLKELEAEHGPLPKTPTAQSGGGGRHYYFACPKDFQAKDKIAGCEGLELISVKGGVVIPPSIHPDTKRRYEWLVAPWDVPLAQAHGDFASRGGDAKQFRQVLGTPSRPLPLHLQRALLRISPQQ